MRRTLVTTIAVLATATLFTVTASNAATHTFTFQSSDAELTATGEFTVNAADEVTSVSGTISGLTNQVISGVTANPSFPSASYSPDGSFIFDNLLLPHRHGLRLQRAVVHHGGKLGRLLESLGELARRLFAL